MQDQKKIGFWTCTALVVGNVIGMGIFVLPASLAPFGFNALIGWGVVAVGCLVLARVLAYLASALPDAEGPYGYIRNTLGEMPAFAAMWAYWVSMWLTNAALATGVVGYMIVVFPAMDGVHSALFPLLLLWSIVIVNLFGVRVGGRVQIVTTLLKLLPMLAIAGVGGWVLLSSPASYVAHTPTTPVTLGGVMVAATIALYAMLGIESASVPAARVENPGHTIPRATMTGTIIVAVIYIIVSAVPLLLLGQEELGGASAPFALVLERFGAAGSGRWLALFVMISGLGALNGWTLLVGELTRTMSANGVLPKPLSRNNRHGAPVVALLVTGMLASAMIWMSHSQSLVAAFTFLTLVVTAANLPMYLGCLFALLVLWRRRTGKCAARKVPWIAGAGLGFVILIFIGTGKEPFLYALGMCAAGLPLYVWMRRRRKLHPT